MADILFYCRQCYFNFIFIFQCALLEWDVLLMLCYFRFQGYLNVILFYILMWFIRMYYNVKGGYLHQDLPPLSALDAEADSCLFSAIEIRADHVLSHLLPPRKKTKYSLRPQTHEYVLPYKDTRNFIPRFLYGDLYCRKDWISNGIYDFLLS